MRYSCGMTSTPEGDVLAERRDCIASDHRSASAMLAEFHAACGQPFGHGSVANLALRRQLHIEEHCELIEALDSADLATVAQELADVVYVAYGTAHSLGIPLDAVLAEVHRANMSKFGPDGQPILRGDGKVMKSAEFVPADVAAVLDELATALAR
jgi:NTP pyrophosphatase (non-canonical NTP hydrolase)